MSEKYYELKQSTDLIYINMFRENINIVLYVANDVEFSETYNFLAEKSNNRLVKFAHSDNIYYIGNIGEYTVALVKGGIVGQESTLSSIITINKALKTFYNCDYLITVGVCGGFKGKVALGDVVVAYEMINYESQKIHDGKITDRSQGLISGDLGYKLSSEVALMNFGYFDVHFGKVLSGNKVVSDKDFAEKLLEIHPDAMALDMEGYAVARVAVTKKLKDWIFIKSPSDFLQDKQGSRGQDKATRNALVVLEKLLYSPNLLHKRKMKVLISGAYVFDANDTPEAEQLAYALSQRLVDENYKLVSGYGMCIGNALVAGAYNSYCTNHTLGESLQNILEVYPFPRIVSGSINKTLNAIKYENRQLMAKGCSFTIFLYGRKNDDSLSEGMEEEFRLASNSFVIPVGCTGYMASELWSRVNTNFEKYYPNNATIKKSFLALNAPVRTIDQIVDRVLDLMEKVKTYYLDFKV